MSIGGIRGPGRKVFLQEHRRNVFEEVFSLYVDGRATVEDVKVRAYFTSKDGEFETPDRGTCYCPLIEAGDDVGPGPMVPEGRARLREIQPPQFIGIPLEEGHGFSRS